MRKVGIGSLVRSRAGLFDRQVRTLLEKGYPQAAGMAVEHFLGYITPLRREVAEAGSTEGRSIPFLIVVPERFVALPKQLSLVMVDGKAGQSYLHLGVLRNTSGMETPNEPYLVLEVEDGTLTKGLPPAHCISQFKKENRRGLTPEEGVALITHFPEVLNSHAIDLCASDCHAGRVPFLFLDTEGPRLGWSDNGEGLEYCGSASCSDDTS